MDETFETSKRPPRFPAGLMSERGVRCGPNEWGMVIGPYGGENRTQRVDGALMVQELLVLGWGGIHPADAACEDCVLALIKANRDFGVGSLGWIHLPLRTVVRIVRAHGGVRPPRVALPRPAVTVRSMLAAHTQEAREVVDRNAARYLEESDRFDPVRHAELILATETKVAEVGDADFLFCATCATEVLEAWGEDVISNLPQAFAYALAAHAEWRAAGAAWLERHRLTWARDYQRLHPDVVSMARRWAGLGANIPQWLCRGRLPLVPDLPALPAKGTERRDWPDATFRHHRSRCAHPKMNGPHRPWAGRAFVNADGTLTGRLETMLETGNIVGERERALCSLELIRAATTTTDAPDRVLTVPIASVRAILDDHNAGWDVLPAIAPSPHGHRETLAGRIADEALRDWLLHDAEHFALAYEPDLLQRHDALIAYAGGPHFAVDGMDGGLQRAVFLTLVLDAWGDTAMHTLPMAIAYAHSLHQGWRSTALDWLEARRFPYLQNYRMGRPELRVVTRAVTEVVQGLPVWLTDS